MSSVNSSQYQNVQDYRLFQKIMEEERKKGGGTTSPPSQTSNEQGKWTIKQQQQARKAIERTSSSNLYNFLDKAQKNQAIEYGMKAGNPKKILKKSQQK